MNPVIDRYRLGVEFDKDCPEGLSNEMRSDLRRLPPIIGKSWAKARKVNEHPMDCKSFAERLPKVTENRPLSFAKKVWPWKENAVLTKLFSGETEARVVLQKLA